MCPVCRELYVSQAEVQRAEEGPLHPYIIASFVVAGCGLIFGGVLGVVAIGFSLAARSHGDRRWTLGLAAGVGSIIVGAFLSLLFLGFFA